MSARWAGLVLCVAGLAGCQTVPPVPVEGQAIGEVAEQQGDRISMVYRFEDRDATYAFGKLRISYDASKGLVFIKDRLACVLAGDMDIVEWRMVAQPDAIGYFAAKLKYACGQLEQLPERDPAATAVPIPEVPHKPTAQEWREAHPAAAALGDLVGMTAGMVLTPVFLAAAVPVLTVSSINGEATEKRRGKVNLGMTRAEVEAILGAPTVEVALPGSRTTVLAYVVGSMTPSSADSWYLGIQDDKLIWMHAEDEWLDGLAEQVVEARKKQK